MTTTTTTQDSKKLATKVPWAGVATATTTKEGLKSQEILAEGGLDFNVGIRPLYRTMRDGTVIQCDRDREVFVDDEQMAALDQLQLGTVRTRYTPLPNREIFAFGDYLIESGDGMWHAVGQQNNYSRTFMIMRLAEEFQVAGDAHQIYMHFRTAHDGSGAIRADALPFRLACFNQNQISGVAGLSASWRVIHTTNVQDRLAEAEASLKMAAEYGKLYKELAEKLVTVEVTPERGVKLIHKIIKKNRTRRDEVIADIEMNWLSSETIPNEVRFTGWGLLNAVTEYFGHICDRRGNGNSLYESIMTGEAAKARELLVRQLL